MNKHKLREQNKKLRKEKNFHHFDTLIAENIKNLDTYKSAQSVMIFHPLSEEINILDLLKNTDKTFSFPCIRNNEIIPYIGNGTYEKGCFNILEPKDSNPQNLNELNLIIAPALAVDLNGNRVGYGKGYYDRFIKNLDRTKTKIAVVIYEDFLVDQIDCDEFDEKVDIIVTEKRIIKR